MTRINLVDPGLLGSRHLLAEWRELPRVFPLASKAYLRHGEDLGGLVAPGEYVLGQGHVKFFYDKLGFLFARHASLTEELMGARGFNLSFDTSELWNQWKGSFPASWLEDRWQPSKEEINRSVQRLNEKGASINYATKI